MATVHDERPLDLQLLKGARQRKFLARHVHEHTSHCHSGAAAGTPQHRHPLAQRRENAMGGCEKGANCHDEMAQGISKMRYKRSHLFQSFWRSLYAI